MLKLEIILKSDLCAGSGESNGNSIDTDICTDELGFPYIPGRRIKGCLKDSAVALKNYGDEFSNDESIIALFGGNGGNSGSLKIGNAYMENLDSMKGFVRSNRAECLKSFTKSNSIVSLFTSVRGQTRIDENGIAQDGSLRYMRVLNQYSSLDGKPLRFVADVNVDGKDKELLERCCRATRHIGTNRNRGLGNVEMRLIEYNESTASVSHETKQLSGKVCISYSLSLDEPVTLPGNDEQLTSIPARSVIGCMVKEYLRNGSSEDKLFKDLFLNGNCVWTSLNPVINGKHSNPAPLNVMRTPNETFKFINLYNHKDFKGKSKTIEKYFAVKKDDGYKLCDVDYHTVYHHSKDEDGGLYMQTSLDKEMVYGGEVYADSKMADDIIELLKNARLAFGRSKSAQYSGCTLRSIEVDSADDSLVSIKANEEFYVLLKSDMVFVKDGVYVCGAEDIREELSKRFGAELELESAYCNYHVISGYHAMWQLQKPQIRTVRGGSIYRLKALNDFNTGVNCQLGLYPQEGFGLFEIITEDEMSRLDNISKASADKVNCSNSDNEMFKGAVIAMAAEEELRLLASRVMEEKVDNYRDRLKHSSIGRLRNMLSDAQSYSQLVEMVNDVKESDKNSAVEVTRKQSLTNIINDVYEGEANIDSMLRYNKELCSLAKNNEYARKKINSMWKNPLWVVVHNLYYNIGGKE